MATFPALFKGAAPGTHWHTNDARLSGFMAAATRPHTTNAVLGHITHYSHPSPYVSFSFSFAVARGYALDGPTSTATALDPGYVYEIDLSAVVGGPRPLDTLLEIAKAGHAHEHNGDQSLLLGIADPTSNSALTTAVPLPGGRTAPPLVSQALRALVFAARDAEVLLYFRPRRLRGQAALGILKEPFGAVALSEAAVMSEATMPEEVRLDWLDLGASWKAVKAWVRSGPLVLVQAELEGRETVRARVDLDKRVFIDPTPFDSSGTFVDSLAAVLGNKRRSTRTGP